MPSSKLSNSEYTQNLHLAWLLSSQLLGMPVDSMLAQARTADALGPILDPTSWRQNGQKLQEDIEMLEALTAARSRLRKMAAAQAEQAGGS